MRHRIVRLRLSVLVIAVAALAALGGKCVNVPPLPLFAQLIVLPSTAQPPADTPGSPGVVVAPGSKLAAQLGPGADLNNALYTRWRLNGPEVQPDAILVVVAGFGGGANNYKLMAEDLIPLMRDDFGLVLEVWGFHRRSNQLEDRSGMDVAALIDDRRMALDWFFGDDLFGTADVGGDGVPDSLDPLLATLFGRRAVFYDTSSDIPFLANWTSQTHSLDIDVVVQQARATARNANVFLAGHSAGTGFAARYAATDFDLSGFGPEDPGYARLRGLVLLEGGGGSTGGALSNDSLDRIIARFDGGLYHAVRTQAPSCVDGTPCTVATEAVDCAGLTPAVCTPQTSAYSSLAGPPQILAASEVLGLQARSNADDELSILQQDQGAAGNNPIAKVPALGLLAFVVSGPSTAQALFGAFLDDEGLAATLLSPAVATSVGAPGPVVAGLNTWLDINEGPMPPAQLPDNGPAPTTVPAGRWGQEREVVDMNRFQTTFLHARQNAADWYYASSGLSVTSVPGVCNTGTGLCTAGAVGSACGSDDDCDQSISLDSTALSVGRGRRDIVNLTQAADIDVPVICFGGSNGLAPVPASFLAFAQSIDTCAAASCDGTPRVVDPSNPNPAFPTFGGVEGGFEVHISEGLAHNDVLTSEDLPGVGILGPLADFIARNAL